MRTLSILFIFTFVLTMAPTVGAFAEGNKAATPAATTAAPAAATGDGAAIFKAQNCKMCHGEGGKGASMAPALAGVGKRHDAAWFKGFLNKTTELNNKKHMGTFNGTPAELDILIAWFSKL